MKGETMRHAIGGIDPLLVESADKAENAFVKQRGRKHMGLKRALLIAAAVILTVCGLLMLNANVRAAVLGVFVRQTDDGHTVVKFADPETEDESVEHKTVYDVTVGYVPDGLTVVNDIDCSLYHYPLEESRIIDLLDETAEDPYNNPSRYVRIDISSSRLYEMNISTEDDFGDQYLHTTIRGMDAYIKSRYDDYMKAFDEDEELKRLYERLGIEPNDSDGGAILFGDSDIMVAVFGDGLSMDELIRVAENIIW